MKRIIHIIFAAACIFIALTGCKTSAEADEFTGASAMEIVSKMGKGWNLGNTFDANGGNRNDVYSQEQSWGNPKVTKELIDGVKTAGFDTIRIPVTWYRHITSSENYKIDDEFIARVKEIVDYAYDAGLFVIINLHHEEWVNDAGIDKNYEKIGEELVAVWEQLADSFAGYDEHLIFEGMNEPRAQGTSYEWVGNEACYKAVNYLDSLFVNTVRKNGKGYNSERALMIPGYAASSNPAVLKSIEIPAVDGKQAENIIISVHCYSPYEFCLTDNKTDFNPKNSSDTGDIISLMSNIDKLFIQNGIPVIIGECGCTNSHDNNDARKEWFAFFGNVTSSHSIPAILWDNGATGNSGGECHNYFIRKTGEMYSPDLINAFVMGTTDTEEVTSLSFDFEPKKQGDSTVVVTPSENGFRPKSLTQKAKINHTDGVPVGFSLFVKGADDGAPFATLQVSRLAGKNSRITFYCRADSDCKVTAGIDDCGETDIITADIGNEWTKVCFTWRFTETECEKLIVFRGDSPFFLDDITVEACEETVEPYFERAEGRTESDEKKEIAASNESKGPEKAAGNESDKSIEAGREKNSDGMKAGAGIASVMTLVVAVALAVVAVIFVKKRK